MKRKLIPAFIGAFYGREPLSLTIQYGMYLRSGGPMIYATGRGVI